jgi:hypothetical protein
MPATVPRKGRSKLAQCKRKENKRPGKIDKNNEPYKKIK